MLINILVALVALLHLYILWFEMFAWTTRGPQIFKNFPKHLFPETKAMAANQGLYNGFLAAGLIWSLLISNSVWHYNVAFFFLACVAVAGIYGALTADRKVFFTQALPALVAMSLILIEWYG
ncbi:DUF1304 domain-containing protein [Larkinella harenae]